MWTDYRGAVQNRGFFWGVKGVSTVGVSHELGRCGLRGIANKSLLPGIVGLCDSFRRIGGQRECGSRFGVD